MSVSPTSRDLSNHETRSWLIIVIVLVVIAWPLMGTVAATYTDAVALASLLITVGGTAAKNSNRHN
ncbi:hypothetical protein JCM4814A_12160 [Streptomyces phaeofaciens JCM 4814]|uniref:Uncharacterized protein n=1 Tax=Streptomyces phaeofaciens TaxID=68254 RepID=A0A918HFH4_9ACTN|nr:hypothetical protein [Streptomyces phaeofaciens]GGT60628.1 hypothetical protein GCM10010226_42690 [Streptomyces phaeofaciens]